MKQTFGGNRVGGTKRKRIADQSDLILQRQPLQMISRFLSPSLDSNLCPSWFLVLLLAILDFITLTWVAPAHRITLLRRDLRAAWHIGLRFGMVRVYFSSPRRPYEGAYPLLHAFPASPSCAYSVGISGSCPQKMPRNFRTFSHASPSSRTLANSFRAPTHNMSRSITSTIRPRPY